MYCYQLSSLHFQTCSFYVFSNLPCFQQFKIEPNAPQISSPRSMPTARVLHPEKRPISGSGLPGSGGSAFSQFKSAIIPRTEDLSTIMDQQRRSREQRTLVNHLTEQQKHRTTSPEQRRYTVDRQRLAEQSRTIAEQQRNRTLAEQQSRTLAEQQSRTIAEQQSRTIAEQQRSIAEAQQRSLIEQRGAAGLTEAQLRGLSVSGLTDMQALEHVARSIAESQQQAVARSLAESQQADAARQQRMLHQELAAALAAHTQSPNQLQQVLCILFEPV